MPKKPITIADIVRVFGECELLDERGIFLPINKKGRKNKEHDYDFIPSENSWEVTSKFGEEGEEWIKDIFEDNNKVEIKTERKIWINSHNMAIEYANLKDEPTGISTTKAKTWIHSFTKPKKDGSVERIHSVIYDVERLKKFVKYTLREGIAKKKIAGEDYKGNKNAKIIVIPISEMHKYLTFI
tara:strand:- start:565 stop:1116 length:552 start_codon:yes stop_codon:yes gene_type:complete